MLKDATRKGLTRARALSSSSHCIPTLFCPMASSTTTQLTQILWLFAVILVLYILFGILFIVFSHLQERLQRRPGGRECPLRSYSWDHLSLTVTDDDDVEGQMPDGQCPYAMNLTIHVDVPRFGGFPGLEKV
ncbi:hypothetical protein FB45DRAFT_997673 [Roridomyces roridus]|uniref:Uncharacterized protein n=1 Tax=Roridomyces roridus TaxID=1738132 RepID=A0AAD7CKA0_9AGAR|nr:hypothetical protein FB45DRAFT_997673 [Roridomyces roridus]